MSKRPRLSPEEPDGADDVLSDSLAGDATTRLSSGGGETGDAPSPAGDGSGSSEGDVRDEALLGNDADMGLDESINVSIPMTATFDAWDATTPAAAGEVEGEDEDRTSGAAARKASNADGTTFVEPVTPARATTAAPSVHRTPRWASLAQDTPDMGAQTGDDLRPGNASLTPRATGHGRGLSVAIPWRRREDDLGAYVPPGLTPRRELDYVPASPLPALPDFSPFLGDLTWPTASAETASASPRPQHSAGQPVDVTVPTLVVPSSAPRGPPSSVPAAEHAQAIPASDRAPSGDSARAMTDSPSVALSRGATHGRGRRARRASGTTQRSRQRVVGSVGSVVERMRDAGAGPTQAYERVERLSQPEDVRLGPLMRQNAQLMRDMEEKSRMLEHAMHHADILARQIAILHQRFRVMQQIEAFSSRGQGKEVEHLARRLTEENSTLRLELEAERRHRGILNARLEALANKTKSVLKAKEEARQAAEERAARNGLANAENLGLAAKLRRANTVLQSHVRELKARLAANVTAAGGGGAAAAAVGGGGAAAAAASAAAGDDDGRVSRLLEPPTDVVEQNVPATAEGGGGGGGG